MDSRPAARASCSATSSTSFRLPFGFRLAAFFDIGKVYGFTTPFALSDLRKAAGGGIRWQSPFGPIRVDYGFNLDRRPGEEIGAFNFSVGSPF